MGFVDNPHAAFVQLFDDLVMREKLLVQRRACPEEFPRPVVGREKGLHLMLHRAFAAASAFDIDVPFASCL